MNLLGAGLPIVAAVLAIPLFVHGLGTARFGVLSLVWMVVGYYSLFDLGIGRALIHVVATRLATGREEEIPTVFWTALLLMTALGVCCGTLVALVTPWAVNDVLEIPAAMRQETSAAFLLVALSIPIVVTNAGLRGLLEAYQRFDLTNLVRVPLGVLSYLAPLVVLPFSTSLVLVVLVLVLVRLATWTLHLLLCLRTVPALAVRVRLRRSNVRTLLHFGGWLTISNVVSTIMAMMDRFLVGALLSASAVAFYAVPYEVTNKLMIIPAAIIMVLFPAFSAAVPRDPQRAAMIFRRALKYILLAFFPVVVVVVGFAEEGLRLWVGGEFAARSSGVLRWLAVGVLINSLALVPFTLIQGSGRPQWTAALHLVELPLYATLMVALLRAMGIEGVAIAWTLRTAVDAVVLFAMASRVIAIRWPGRRLVLLGMGFTFGSLAVVAIHPPLFMRAAMVAGLLAAFIPSVWYVFLNAEERGEALRLVVAPLAAYRGTFAASRKRAPAGRGR